MSLILVAVTISLYLLTTAWLGYRLFGLNLAGGMHKLHLLPGCGIALILHAVAIYQNIIAPDGFNLGFYNAFSLMSWTVVLLVCITVIFKPVENLALFFLPVAALSLGLAQMFPVTRIISDSYALGLQLHILLSVTAFSLFVMAALQAIVLSIQEKQLRNKHPVRIMQILPPLQIMEELLVQLVAIGSFLLSLSLATGLMFVHDLFAQHLVHKTVLSIFGWLIFAILLWGRWTRGWRGKILVRWTLGGFISLLLAYFGTKFVLELILKRV
ncbi:MAG TPA: cytochrome c biogenesis protein CcsA [Gammaproteobacteria bacterium]|nr:cytochrome c biogenesis protein CcsA [Gammaproteobacteria bacterium]